MKKSVLLVFVLVIAQMMWAWGPMGHRIVAEVAYHYLSPEACADVDEVLGIHGMVYWATWPDEIKSDKQFYPMSYDWHFQDLPEGLNIDQLSLLRKNYPTHGGNLWTTLDQLLIGLPMHENQLLVNGVEMPYHDALVFLVHLTADELCPMHMAHEEDKGGNDVKVDWRGVPTNLHKVWDEKVIESRGYSYSEYAQMLVDTYGEEMPAISEMSEMEFVALIYNTTKTVYEDVAKNGVDPYLYTWRWKQTLDKLLFMAGVRLAQNIQSIR